MRLTEAKAAVLAITENIEMKLFSSEESCVVTRREVEEDQCFYQRHLEHPLVPLAEEDLEPQVQIQIQIQPRYQAKPVPATRVVAEPDPWPPAPGLMEEKEIEMEVFPPHRVSEIQPDHPSIVTPTASPDRAHRLRWKRRSPQRTGLAVRDVVCLPRGCYLAQPERHVVPQGRERAALAAAGMTARITIDCGWSAGQMESRLATLFRGRFVQRAGQRFSFTYLQCVQGLRALFVPDAPKDGWTGDQVLRISGHGVLYILSHLDCPQQGDSEGKAREAPAVDGRDFCLAASMQSCQGEKSPPVQQTEQRSCKMAKELASVLRRFRRENVAGHAETHVRVRRRDLLQGALRALRRPGFCFRATPVISFSGEETDGHEGPLREFFRLTLLELQQSRVFEGRPGSLFFSYDLTALEEGKYYEAGVLIGWSLAHGGPGPRCLHPALYQLMCGRGSALEDFSWKDVADAEVRLRLQQLRDCTDVKQLSPSLRSWISSCGLPVISSARPDEMPAIYARLAKHYVYHRVASMISQFVEGLNSCGGLWHTVQSHWEAFEPVMTSAQQRRLTPEWFKRIFAAARYSHPGSRLRAAEEATVARWESVLVMISDGKADFALEDLLAFITGSDHVPPLGFPKLISMCFYSQDAAGSSVRLPHASTCALELSLPRGVAEDADLLALLSRAVHEALGFTGLQMEADGEGGNGEVMPSV